MDLTKNFPRSPRQRVEGIAMLARTIDKARAKEAGRLGEYIYDCPMDRKLFTTLATTQDEFSSVVSRSKGDEGVVAWLRQRTRPSADEIEAHNLAIENWKPSSPQGRARFEAQRDLIAPGRSDAESWTDLIEIEEGRMTPGRR
jgi:hypothetical protein